MTLKRVAKPGAITTQSASLKLQWYAASRITWVNFQRSLAARRAADAGNGRMHRGAKLSMRFSKPSTVTVTGLDENTTAEDVRELVCSLVGAAANTQGAFAAPAAEIHIDDISSVSFSKPAFRNEDAGKILTGLLEEHGTLSSFQAAPATGPKHKAMATFVSSADATKACRLLHNTPLPALGGGKMFVEQVFSAKFVLPSQVFDVVNTRVLSLVGTLNDNDPEANMQHRVIRSGSKATILLKAGSVTALAAVRRNFDIVVTISSRGFLGASPPHTCMHAPHLPATCHPTCAVCRLSVL